MKEGYKKQRKKDKEKLVLKEKREKNKSKRNKKLENDLNLFIKKK